jgi:hypothetical protein
VLLKGRQDRVALLTWEQDSLPMRTVTTRREQRYRGLRGGILVGTVESSPSGLLVKSDVAARIIAGRKLASLTIEPTSTSVPPGGRVNFTVKGFDQQGLPVDVPQPVWKAAGGVVDSQGIFAAGKEEGQFSIEASIGLLAAAALIEISRELPAPPPDLIQKAGPKRFPRERYGSLPVGRDGQVAERSFRTWTDWLALRSTSRSRSTPASQQVRPTALYAR